MRPHNVMKARVTLFPKLDQRPFWRRKPIFTSYVGCILALIVTMFLLFYRDYRSQSIYDNFPTDPIISDEFTQTGEGLELAAHDILDRPGEADDVIAFDSKGNLHHSDQHHHHTHKNHTLVPDKPWGQTYEPVRVWCLVPTLWPKKKFVMQAIAETWGRHCDELMFVIDDLVDAPDRLFNATLLKLSFEHRQSTKDRNIWEKVWKMWYHVGMDHIDSADWFLKIDDDTFFSAVNFRGFVRYLNPDKPWYLGHTLMHIWRSKNIVFNSGTCYALSRASLKKLAPLFGSESFLNDPQRRSRGKQYCVHRAGAEEDPTVGVCLRSMGIRPGNSLDNEFRERFLPFRPGDHAKIERENTWFWQHKHPKVGTKDMCCAEHPISFHNYKRDPMKSFKELDEQYNQPEGKNGKKFQVPKEIPIEFKHGEIKFGTDEYGNTLNPPAGQRVYRGPGRERECHNCDNFKFK